MVPRTVIGSLSLPSGSAAAHIRRVWRRGAGSGRTVHVVVLDKDRVSVEDAIPAIRALDHDASTGLEHRGHTAALVDGHFVRPVGHHEADSTGELAHRARLDQAAQPHTLA